MQIYLLQFSSRNYRNDDNLCLCYDPKFRLSLVNFAAGGFARRRVKQPTREIKSETRRIGVFRSEKIPRNPTRSRWQYCSPLCARDAWDQLCPRRRELPREIGPIAVNRDWQTDGERGTESSRK